MRLLNENGKIVSRTFRAIVACAGDTFNFPDRVHINKTNGEVNIIFCNGYTAQIIYNSWQVAKDYFFRRSRNFAGYDVILENNDHIVGLYWSDTYDFNFLKKLGFNVPVFNRHDILTAYWMFSNSYHDADNIGTKVFRLWQNLGKKYPLYVVPYNMNDNTRMIYEWLECLHIDGNKNPLVKWNKAEMPPK